MSEIPAMVSVIIPTLNAAASLGNLIASLRGQTVPSEIIVVDSSSNDDTTGIAESEGVRVISIGREHFDHGGTRSMAGKEASGRFLVYLTQDVVPAADSSLENLIKPLQDDSRCGAAFGRQLPFPGAGAFAAHLRSFNYPERSYTRSLDDRRKYGIKTVFLSNSFAAYRRKALEDIGWFKENLILGEDTHAAARMLLAGYRIAYGSDAMVYHSHNYTAFQELKRYFDTGVFHKREEWLLEEFGRAEGEGGAFIRSEFRYLMKDKKFYLLPVFFYRNMLKYIGYKLGTNYGRLSKEMIKRISMHRDWWDKQNCIGLRTGAQGNGSPQK